MGFESPKMPSPEEMAKIEKETIESKIEKFTEDEKRFFEIQKKTGSNIENIDAMFNRGKIDDDTRKELYIQTESLRAEAVKSLLGRIGEDRAVEIEIIRIEQANREEMKQQQQFMEKQEKSSLETNKESVKKSDNLYEEIYKDKEIAEIFETIVNSKYHPRVKLGEPFPKYFLQRFLEEFPTLEKFEEYKNKSSEDIERHIEAYPSREKELLERQKRWEGWLEKFKKFVY